MYRDEPFIALVRKEASKLVGKKKPALEKEITRIEDQAAKSRQGSIGTLKPSRPGP